MKTFIAILTMVFATASSTAAELTPFLHDGELGVRLEGVRFPENLDTNLKSGLTNRILIRITLEQTGQRVQQRAAEIMIRYDLWDENFVVLTRLDGIAVDSTIWRSVQEVRAFIGRIRLSRLFKTDGIGMSNELRLDAELLLNPIDRERMENIRKWVVENSSRAPLDPAGVLAASDASLANAIFNKIFEQYASGSDVATIWQQRVSALPFTLDGLDHERR